MHVDRAKSHGRILDWTEAGLWIVLLVVGSLVALAVLRDNEGRSRPRPAVKPAPGGLIEAENLPEDEIVVLTDEIAPDGEGQGRLRGTTWTVKNLGESTLAAGTSHPVDRVGGLKLFVR